MNAGVTVILKGGLGNQLFQYAMGRALSLRLGVPLSLDLSWFKEIQTTDGQTTTIRQYALVPYGLNVSTHDAVRYNGRLASLLLRLSKKVKNCIPACLVTDGVYQERSFGFDSKIYSMEPPISLDGYWQSHLYFDGIAEVLRQDLGQPQGLSEKTQAFVKQINSTDSIAVHIRRGDYLSNQKASATHGVCSVEYYKKGLEAVSIGLSHPHCFVFSDEPEWARNNLHFAMPTTVVDINGPEAAHEDLWLMSACDRFVIANSSLSWWAAWLSHSVKKVVVAPRQWFANGAIDTRDLIPSDWVRL